MAANEAPIGRYKGDSGMRRWVGLGVIGDNLVTIGAALARTPHR